MVNEGRSFWKSPVGSQCRPVWMISSSRIEVVSKEVFRTFCRQLGRLMEGICKVEELMMFLGFPIHQCNVVYNHHVVSAFETRQFFKYIIRYG